MKQQDEALELINVRKSPDHHQEQAPPQEEADAQPPTNVSPRRSDSPDGGRDNDGDEPARRVSLSNSDDSEEGCRRTSRVREASRVSFYSAASSPNRANASAGAAAKASRARRKRRPHSSPRGDGDTQGPRRSPRIADGNAT